jgi:hypothetical protein
LVRRSDEIDRFASSSREAGTTGSGLVEIFRFMGTQYYIHYGRNRGHIQPVCTNLTESSCCPLLRRFRDLNYGSDIKRGTAAAALLAGGDAGKLPFEVELRRNRVRANRAMSQPLSMVCNECFHINHPYNGWDANSWAEVVKNIVKILKFPTGTGRAPWIARRHTARVLRWKL